MLLLRVWSRLDPTRLVAIPKNVNYKFVDNSIRSVVTSMTQMALASSYGEIPPLGAVLRMSLKIHLILLLVSLVYDFTT